MKKSVFTILQYLFFLALGVLFIWLAVKDIGEKEWNQIKSSIANARHWLVVPVILLLLLSHFSRALRWKILMEPLGYKPTTFNVWSAVMIGYLVNAGVPRLGEVVKCTLLAKYEKVRADKLIGTIVLERILDLIFLLLVFILALVSEYKIIGEYTSNMLSRFFQDNTGHLSITKVILVIVVIAAFFISVFFLLKRFGHIDIIAKVKNIVGGMLHGLGSIRYIKHKGLFIFHSVFIWLMYLLSTTIGLYALKETDHLGIGAGLTTLAVGSVGMIVTPGGIGAYPLFIAKLMVLYGLDESTTGTAFGWLLWTVQTFLVLGAGLIFSGLFSYHNKKRKNFETGQQYS